jgi:hypothetical protein
MGKRSRIAAGPDGAWRELRIVDCVLQILIGLLLVFGLRVEMAFPKLIDLPVVAAGHAEVELEGAVPVIALLRQSKLMPRFLLTWAAATHCPRFLKPVQDCCADSPVRAEILSDSFVFWVNSWSMVLPLLAAALLVWLPAPLELAWLEPAIPLGLPIPIPPGP